MIIRSTTFFTTIAVVLVAPWLLVGCQPMQTIDGAQFGVDRTSRVAKKVDEAVLRQGAAKAYQDRIAQIRAADELVENSPMTARVTVILWRLSAQVSIVKVGAVAVVPELTLYRANRPDLDCLPGGRFFLSTALLAANFVTDDELAMLIAHHLAHALSEHGRERANDQIDPKLQNDMAAMAAWVTWQIPFSRLHEQEADRVGIELAARAGYDPAAVLPAWRKMNASLLHGLPERRIQDLSNQSQRVLPLFEASRRR